MIERLDIYLYTYLEINKADFVNASMQFYLPETTIPVDLYLTSDGVIHQCNPIIANRLGRFPKIYIDKPYRAIVKNRHGAQLFQGNFE